MGSAAEIFEHITRDTGVAIKAKVKKFFSSMSKLRNSDDMFEEIVGGEGEGAVKYGQWYASYKKRYEDDGEDAPIRALISLPGLMGSLDDCISDEDWQELTIKFIEILKDSEEWNLDYDETVEWLAVECQGDNPHWRQ